MRKVRLLIDRVLTACSRDNCVREEEPFPEPCIYCGFDEENDDVYFCIHPAVFFPNSHSDLCIDHETGVINIPSWCPLVRVTEDTEEENNE